MCGVQLRLRKTVMDLMLTLFFNETMDQFVFVVIDIC